MILAPFKKYIFEPSHSADGMADYKIKSVPCQWTRYAEQYSESLWHFGNLSIMPCARRTGKNIRHAAQGLDHGFADSVFRQYG